MKEGPRSVYVNFDKILIYSQQRSIPQGLHRKVIVCFIYLKANLFRPKSLNSTYLKRSNHLYSHREFSQKWRLERCAGLFQSFLVQLEISACRIRFSKIVFIRQSRELRKFIIQSGKLRVCKSNSNHRNVTHSRPPRKTRSRRSKRLRSFHILFQIVHYNEELQQNFKFHILRPI